MNKKKIFNSLKILIIIFLVIAISFLVIMQWKSDVIITKVIGMVETQLEDSLKYENVSLEWFRYFPSAAIRLENLQLGTEKAPFLREGTVDVVIALFPLFNEKIVINRLLISDSHLSITKQNGKWSYDLFKKDQTKPENQKAGMKPETDSSKWEALLKQLNLENTTLIYNDDDNISFAMDVNTGQIKGDLGAKSLMADIELTGKLEGLTTKSYKQSESIPFELTGGYRRDNEKGIQELKNWKIKSEGIDLEGVCIFRNEKDHQWIDGHVSWTDGDLNFIKSLMPAQKIRDWNKYGLSGQSEGKLMMKGKSSKTESPHITFSSELKNGLIKFPGEGGQLKNIVLNLAYDNGDTGAKKNSFLRINFRNGTFQGNAVKADMRLENLDHPVMNLEMEGSLPASVLNLFMDSTSWDFREGFFDMEYYKITGLHVDNLSSQSFIEKSETKLTTENVRFIFEGNDIRIHHGDIKLDDQGTMNIELEELIWNNAKGEDIEGELTFQQEKVDFILKGVHSHGDVEAKGNVTGWGKRPVLNADWKVKGIEMKELLSSFENFDQSFITADHLKGKADIWAVTTIPYDDHGQIITRDIAVKAAIDIRDGELKDMKILEDFSKYVHLDDLKDIRFSQFRNYLNIEDGKVFLPVVFIQSSAINLSIDGVHSFDQKILYNIKLNAGQVAANKLKKMDVIRRFKQARKSGWINLHYVLSGTTSDVHYAQDQKQVISAFEQSRLRKENLRNYLVDKFGHDVYWLEPNEWEDIPEYK